MILKKFSIFSSKSPWALRTILFELTLISKPNDVIKWFLLRTLLMIISNYANVCFFEMIATDISRGLIYLIVRITFENFAAYCSLKENLSKKIFVLDFLKRFRTKLNQRILSANWMKIKLSDQIEIRRKIEECTSSVQYLMEEYIEALNQIAQFVMSFMAIIYIFPVATIVVALVYICSYRLYLNKKSNELLQEKLKIIEKTEKLNEKYSRANANMFEYVIHHEKNKIINVTNDLKIGIERRWFELDFLYDRLSFEQDILGKLSTFLIICSYWLLNGAQTLIVPLFYYLTEITRTIESMMTSYIRWLRLIKDYDVVRPILEEYQERINAEQIDVKSFIELTDLSFHYQGKREGFHLKTHEKLRFEMGQVILITGKSGAGKSTFYDILNGSIGADEYSAQVRIDSHDEPKTFHSIERCRTMVLQDSDMDYRSTIYSMITDIDDDVDVEQLKMVELDDEVWKFLRLVKIDDFVHEELNDNLHESIDNRLSGGQKTRLLLARALYRAEHRQSPLLILDEPDKGLPAETTVTIIENIMDWYRPKGILFLTLHTERAHLLDFDQVLHVDQGTIAKVK